MKCGEVLFLFNFGFFNLNPYFCLSPWGQQLLFVVWNRSAEILNAKFGGLGDEKDISCMISSRKYQKSHSKYPFP